MPLSILHVRKAYKRTIHTFGHLVTNDSIVTRETVCGYSTSPQLSEFVMNNVRCVGNVPSGRSKSMHLTYNITPHSGKPVSSSCYLRRNQAFFGLTQRRFLKMCLITLAFYCRLIIFLWPIMLFDPITPKSSQHADYGQ